MVNSLGIFSNSAINKKNGFLSRLMEPRYKCLRVEVPYYDFLRGQVFLSDIRDIVNKDLSLDIEDFMTLLYLQFLYQVKRGDHDLKHFGMGLQHKIDLYLLNRKNELTEVKSNEWMLKPLEFESEKEKVAECEIRIKNTEYLRGEVLLNDIEEILEGFSCSVDQIVSILYQDFMTKIKREGNSENAMKQVVSCLEYFGEYM